MLTANILSAGMQLQHFGLRTGHAPQALIIDTHLNIHHQGSESCNHTVPVGCGLQRAISRYCLLRNVPKPKSSLDGNEDSGVFHCPLERETRNVVMQYSADPHGARDVLII